MERAYFKNENIEKAVFCLFSPSEIEQYCEKVSVHGLITRVMIAWDYENDGVMYEDGAVMVVNCPKK